MQGGALTLPTDMALSSASKADLAVALEDAQQALVLAESQKAVNPVVEIGLTNTVAGATAYADARLGDGDGVKIATAAAGALGVLTLPPDNPMHELSRAALVGSTNAISANAGRALGLKHKAEAERERALQRSAPPADPAPAAPAKSKA
jgi:hypothetical protein